MSIIKKIRKEYLSLMFISLIAVIIIIFFIGLFLLKPEEEIIQGEVESLEIRISGKLPGRVEYMYVREGDKVNRGDTLVKIFSSDAEAKLRQAEAMKNVYKAQNKKVDAGTRSELIKSAKDMWEETKAGLSIAKKSYDRMESLFNKGVVSAQSRDEARAKYEAMKASESAAKSQYEMALKGAQIEDKEAAKAMVAAAQGSVEQVEAILTDEYLTSPIDGEVSEIFPNVSELVGAGTPIMNLLDVDDIWVVFNVREELLEKLSVGSKIVGIFPALGMREAPLEVFFIKDMGSYAVWRATKVTGSFDAKTFEVKARPLEKIKNLRPGMSVLVNLK